MLLPPSGSVNTSLPLTQGVLQQSLKEEESERELHEYIGVESGRVWPLLILALDSEVFTGEVE